MTTKLEVLNQMLHVMGEAPVSSDSSQHPSAISAMVTLDRVNRQLQARGWWFNRELELTLNPQVDTGYVIVPDGTLDIDPIDRFSTLVQRGNKLYDPFKHTYAIAEPVIVNLTLQLPIEDLPDAAGQYLIAQCKYEVYVDDDGDANKSTALEKARVLAWAELQQRELQNTDVNSTNKPISTRLLSRTGRYSASGNPMWPGGR